MDLWLCFLYFLPVSGALRILPEVKLKGILGGSVIIECPLPEMSTRAYLCREVRSDVCITVVSSNKYVKKEYKNRVTLDLLQDQNLFIIEMTEVTKSDSGVYACGTGMNTDLGKAKKIILDVYSALSRRVRRLAVRMSALEASQRPVSQRPRVSPRPRSQNNVYSACPRRDRGVQAAGEREAPVCGPGVSTPAAPPQVSEAPWPHVPSLKTSWEYLSIYYQPAAEKEDTDSDDYVNISCLTNPSSCAPGPRPWCQ
ncbi:immunoglobulin mu Fc receptor isoform X3 [Pteronotus mesoamericanus]|uniref:immunoglobulin mu Fc receptor isoform X3 n=1 Tax=Pteronotus mesoamericanus TaxID=1884717 RepID=UPI0023EDACB9|nr:fas apoptotic inhibitory molecule 3 isoform X3 [Pteronotus parnellii mesoamericanus]